MITSLIISLVLTLIIELTVSLILGVRSNYNVLVVLLVNVCTNPIVVYIANCLIMFGASNYIYNFVVTIMEILVVIIEALMLKKYLKEYKKSPWILSLANNVISYSFGLIISIFI